MLWKPIKEKVRFVLVMDGTEKFILTCSNLQWLPEEILQAYSYRFKIEVTFKGLKYLLGSFCYRFWTKAMPKLGKKTFVDLGGVTDATKQRLIAETANAIEIYTSRSGCLGNLINSGKLKPLKTNFYKQGTFLKRGRFLMLRARNDLRYSHHTSLHSPRQSFDCRRPLRNP